MTTFTIDNDEYYPVCYKLNDAKTFKNLVYYFVLANHHVGLYYRLTRLIVVFKIIVIDFKCCIYQVPLKGHHAIVYMCWMNGRMVSKLYGKYKPVRITQKEYLLIWNSETTQKPRQLSS